MHTPTCFIVNGPEYSFIGPEAVSVTVAVNLPLAEIAGVSDDLK